jgi:hypothetical protein
MTHNILPILSLALFQLTLANQPDIFSPHYSKVMSVATAQEGHSHLRLSIHSISGVSSGGGMVANHLFAFSSVVEGAAIVAGAIRFVSVISHLLVV